MFGEAAKELWDAGLAGQAVAGEGEAVDGAEDGGGDLVGLEEAAS